MSTLSTSHAKSLAEVYANVAIRARAVDTFADVQASPDMLSCTAKGSAEPAFYRLIADAGHLWIALVMDNRWQSQSIEQTLMHTGDKLPDLLEEEFANLDMPGTRPPVDHFRDAAKLFTFRSKVATLDEVARDPVATAKRAWNYLLAYEATFHQLGDMDGGDGDEE